MRRSRYSYLALGGLVLLLCLPVASGEDAAVGYESWRAVWDAGDVKAAYKYLLRMGVPQVLALGSETCRRLQTGKPESEWRNLGWDFSVIMAVAEEKTAPKALLKTLLRDVLNRRQGAVWRERILHWVDTEHRKRFTWEQKQLIMRACAELLDDKSDSSFVRARAARVYGMTPYRVSHEFYMQDPQFVRDSTANSSVRAVAMAHQRGITNPYEDAIQEAVERVCKIINDPYEHGAVRQEAAVSLYSCLSLCARRPVRRRAQEVLIEVLADQYTLPEMLVVVGRSLVDICHDKRVSTMLTKRAAALNESLVTLRTLIQEASQAKP